jgi:hypothetical protein
MRDGLNFLTAAIFTGISDNLPGIVVGIMGGFICTFRKSFWQDKSSQYE